MTAPKGDVARQRIRDKLKSPSFPRGLPAAPVGELQGRETMQIGVGVGKRCSGCDESIGADESALATQFQYGVGEVFRLHELCWKIWQEEVHAPITQVRK